MFQALNEVEGNQIYLSVYLNTLVFQSLATVSRNNLVSDLTDMNLDQIPGVDSPTLLARRILTLSNAVTF